MLVFSLPTRHLHVHAFGCHGVAFARAIAHIKASQHYFPVVGCDLLDGFQDKRNDLIRGILGEASSALFPVLHASYDWQALFVRIDHKK